MVYLNTISSSRPNLYNKLVHYDVLVLLTFLYMAEEGENSFRKEDVTNNSFDFDTDGVTTIDEDWESRSRRINGSIDRLCSHKLMIRVSKSEYGMTKAGVSLAEKLNGGMLPPKWLGQMCIEHQFI